MKWVITKDLINDDGDIPSRVGRGNVDSAAQVPQPHVPFRLKDDDGEIYYEGVMDKAGFDDADESLAFAPLDFGMGDAGCTTMEYKEGNGAWTVL